MYFLLSKFDNSIVSNVPTINFPINGLYAIKIPDGVQIDTTVSGFGLNSPNNTQSLIGQKYGGLLALFQQYTNITYDALESTTDIDVSATSPTWGRFGNNDQILAPAIATTGELINQPTAPNGTTTVFTHTTLGVPLVPTTVEILWNTSGGTYSGAVSVATDNGLGGLTPTVGAPTPAVTALGSSVNYTTGAIQVTFATAPTAGSLWVNYSTGGTLKTTVFTFLNGSNPETPVEIQPAYNLYQLTRVINTNGGLSDMFTDTNLDGSVVATLTFVSAANYPTSGSIVGTYSIMDSVPVLVSGSPYAFLTFSNNLNQPIFIKDWALLWHT